jgi:hypothetical protein
MLLLLSFDDASGLRANLSLSQSALFYGRYI